MNLKKAALIAVAVAFFGYLWISIPNGQTRLVGKMAPDIVLPDLDDVQYKLSDLDGKIIFLNFWSVNCPVCIEETPSVQALSAKFPKDKFVVLTVNADGQPKKVKEFMQRGDYDFTVLDDSDGMVHARYSVYKYPETFIISKDGQVIEKFIGEYDWASAEQIDHFQELIKN